MSELDNEIEAKIIEKQPALDADGFVETTEEPLPKPKKERTQAQKDAFEKARKKRMENIQKKKEDKAKQPKKPRGRPRKKSLQPTATLVNRENYPHPVHHQPHQAIQHNIPYQGVGGLTGGMPPAQYYQPQPPPPPQVHNYYYGVNPNSAAPPVPKDLPIVSSEEDYYYTSEEEEEESAPQPEVTFETPSDARYYEPPPQPTMKYRFG